MGEVEVEELSFSQGRALFDSRCREVLGIGGEQFLAEYARNRSMDGYDPCDVCEIVMLLPFVQQVTLNPK